MKLNNKGYVLVEIILASVIAFGIAFYMTNLTIKLKNKNDDIFAETLAMTDQTIIQNKLVSYINTYGDTFSCDKINIDSTNKIISYDGKVIDILNDYTLFDSNNYTCYKNLNRVSIYLPITIDALDKTFVVDFSYIITKSIDGGENYYSG